MLLPLRKHQVDALLHVFGLHQQIIPKMLVDDGADVVDMAEFKKETGQVLELLVGLAVVERDDGDPVRQLQGKGVHRVVYQHHFFEASGNCKPQLTASHTVLLELVIQFSTRGLIDQTISTVMTHEV